MAEQHFEEYARKVGVAIQRLRQAKGLTQEDVAYEADVSIRHYQQIESGKMNPTLKTLFKISRILALPVHKILEAGKLS